MTTLAPPATRAERSLPTPGARVRALLRARPGASAWVTPATIGVLALAGVLYLVNLTVSGYANEYYTAAAWAASQSWLSWLFGSIDPSNFITVDKPPLATMVMGLSVRLFGLSSASILVPEALMGVASVGILMATVRRTFGPAASIIAGVVMALTPSAVLMFRYDNPEALLTLLFVGAAYTFVRALESDRFRWLLATGVLVGLAFNTKLLQGWMVLPAFAITYALFGRGGAGRRLLGLAVSAIATLVASSWWVVAMALVPAELRPYVGGSTDGSALNLILGYDGLGRIFGGSGNGGGGQGGGPSFSGTPGILRLFNVQMAGQASWFLPMSLVGLAAGLVARFRKPRTDLARAAFVMWGAWLAVHAVVFSFMSGTIHSYYTVVMAPAIGALVGGGIVTLWGARERRQWLGLVLAGTVAASAATAWMILNQTPSFVPGLANAVLIAGLALAVILIIPTTIVPRKASGAALVLALAILLAGPAAYAVDTMQTAYSGGAVAAGPATNGMGGGPGGAGQQLRGQGPADGAMTGQLPTDGAFSGQAPVDGGFAGQAPTDGGQAPTDGGQSGVRGGGGPGGTSLSASTLQYLVQNQGTAKWIVAVQSANTAAPIEISTGRAVMAMGGFSGNDNAPTLAQLQALIKAGDLRFVLTGGGGGGGQPGGASGSSSSISSWVTSACTAVSGASGLYDCAGAVQ